MTIVMPSADRSSVAVGLQQGPRSVGLPHERAGDVQQVSPHRAERDDPLLRGGGKYAEFRGKRGRFIGEVMGRC